MRQVFVQIRARWLSLPGVLLLVFLAGGCATQTRELLRAAPDGLPRRAELTTTPFFPQERYQCGPATLAMALQSAGIPATPDTLMPQVYVPEREGSLPPEMLAAGRRNGAVSLLIPPRLEALLAEVAAGTPVVVLQNLGLSWLPRWHYAVAIGYDLDQGDVILRSGLDERLVLPMTTFEHTWERGGHWAMVVLAPGRLPRTVDEATAAGALIAFEKGADPAKARLAYGAALSRWPGNLALLMGVGNTSYAMKDFSGAAEAFGNAARFHPEAAPAHNNLALALAEMGHFQEARLAANRAVALGGPWRAAALDTLEKIDAAQRKAGGRK